MRSNAYNGKQNTVNKMGMHVTIKLSIRLSISSNMVN